MELKDLSDKCKDDSFCWIIRRNKCSKVAKITDKFLRF